MLFCPVSDWQKPFVSEYGEFDVLQAGPQVMPFGM